MQYLHTMVRVSDLNASLHFTAICWVLKKFAEKRTRKDASR